MSPAEYLLAFFAAHPDWASVCSETDGGAGFCVDASIALARQFPELRIASGHVVLQEPFNIVFDTEGGPQKTHWAHTWCVTPCGQIVDPTRDQFPEILAYEAEEIETFHATATWRGILDALRLETL